MDSNNTRIAQGLGVITFFDDGRATALVRSVSEEAWHVGTFDSTGVTIDTDAVSIGLRKPRKLVDNGPRLEGTLVNKVTGESHKVVAWRGQLKDGTPCLGLSEERPMPGRAPCPF